MKSFFKKGINIFSFGTKGTSSARDGDLVMPAHDTNACWMNTFLSALTNLLSKKQTEELKEACLMRGNEKMYSIMKDISELRAGQRDKFSRKTKKIFGYNGSQKDPLTAHSIFETLGGHGWPVKVNAEVFRADPEGCWEAVSKHITGKKAAISVILSTKKIIIDDNKNPKYKDGWLDHVYVLHIVPENGQLKYLLLNDKGVFLDYNANKNELTKKTAEELIKKEGYACITACIDQEQYNKYVKTYSMDEDPDPDGFTVINRENVELDVKQKDSKADNKFEYYIDNKDDDF